MIFMCVKIIFLITNICSFFAETIIKTTMLGAVYVKKHN